MNMNKKYREVAVVLPYSPITKSVLMQLRDNKPGIDAPGVWGFFGGLINSNETPIEGAIRELEEEIGYKSREMHHLNSGSITDLNNIYAHAFTVSLSKNIDKLSLMEGRDFKNVYLNEILDGTIYSNKFNCFFPSVKTYYIKQCFIETLEFWKDK